MADRAEPVRVILDTDMESDVDDVGALAMLHGLVSGGEGRSARGDALRHE